MKKSEFIKKALASKNNTACTTKEQVEVMLNIFEKAGMLPPPLETDVVTSSLVYCYYPKVEELEKDGSIDTAKSKLWEDE